MKRVLAAIFIALLTSPAFADINSMRARVPQVVELKDKGAIGEQLDGLLGVVAGAAGADGLVKAENADRLTVYKDRAKSQGVDLPTFMKVMGEERIKQEKSGRFVQDASGKWIKKP
jgi:uncharacterized protein